MNSPHPVTAFKVLTADQWAQLEAEGVFHGAPVDLADGYIHLSASDQLQGTLDKHFGGQTGLVIAEVDLVACRRPAEVPEGWTFQPLLPDRLVVICGPGHPLTRVARTDWPALMAQEWLLMPAGTAARERFDALTAAAPGPLRTYPLITRVQTPLAWLLRERPLLAMLPLSVVRHLVDAGELVVLPVEDIGDLEPLGLLHAVQEPGEAATRFADFLRSRCAPSGLLAG